MGSRYAFRGAALITLVAASVSAQERRTVVVTVEQAELHLQVDAASAVIARVDRGTVLEALERYGDWWRVVAPGTGQAFYVRAADVAEQSTAGHPAEGQEGGIARTSQQSGPSPRLQETGAAEDSKTSFGLLGGFFSSDLWGAGGAPRSEFAETPASGSAGGGLALVRALSRRTSLELDAIYVHRRYRELQSGEISPGESAANLHFEDEQELSLTELEMLGLARISIGGSGVSAQLGVVTSYVVKAEAEQLTVVRRASDIVSDTSDRVDVLDAVARWKAGLIAGLGVNMPAGGLSLQGRLLYQLGISRLERYRREAPRHRGLRLEIGILF